MSPVRPSSGIPVGRRRPVLDALKVGVPAIAVVAAIIWAVRPPPPRQQVPPPPPPPLPNRVGVVIDASASMAGYFSGRTEFKDSLAKLIASLPRYLSVNQKPPEVSYAFAGEPGQLLKPYEGSAETLIEDVLNNRVPSGGSSMLQDVLREIKDTIGSDEVDFLLTDGIFSYSNAEIKRNPNINKDNIEGLAALVQGVFQHQDWSRKRVKPGLAVLQYLSQFRGTYFTYKNDRLDCCPGPRPFYLWIIGDARRVAATFAVVRQIPGLEPRHAVLLGPGSLMPDARVLNYSNRTGTWIRGRADRLTLQQVPAQGPAQVTIALNLSELPADVLSRDYVLKHLEISGDFATLVPVAFSTRAQVESTLNARDAEDLSRATHFLTLGINALAVKTAKVSVALRDELPAWGRESTTDDDLETAATDTPPRTFGFLPIVTGAANALRSGDPLFQFQLTLER